MNDASPHGTDLNGFERHAQVLASAGKHDWAIELCLMAIEREPDNVERHEALRRISLDRKAKGGRDLGFLSRLKLRWPWANVKARLLCTARLLAYDPDNAARLVDFAQAASAGGFDRTADWAVSILGRQETT